MKKIINSNGETLKGIFKKEDGSLAVIDPQRLSNARLSQQSMENLTMQIDSLQKQVQDILVRINGIH